MARKVSKSNREDKENRNNLLMKAEEPDQPANNSVNNQSINSQNVNNDIEKNLDQRDSNRTLIAQILIIVALIVVYANHFHNDFEYDDSHTIVNNIFIKSIHNIPLFFTDGTTFSSLPSNQSYRPIVTASLALDYWFGKGLDAYYFHRSMFVIFILQGLLMLRFYKEIMDRVNFPRDTFWLATITASLYLLHPANAETINYIISRSDSFSTFFVLLGFQLFIAVPICRKWHLYLIPIGLGALAKPPAVMFAPLLFLYIWYFEESRSLKDLFLQIHRKRLISAIKKALPTIIFCVAIFFFIQMMEPKTWRPGGDSRFNYLITQPFVMIHYVKTFLLPLWLSADTDLTAFTSIWDLRVFIGIAFVIFLLFIAERTSRTETLRPISFGILWFFITLIPTSTIIPLAEVMNDHRLFFPYVGLALSACWSIALLLLRLPAILRENSLFKPMISVAIILILAGYGYGTYRRNIVWHTPESLWQDVTIKSPKSPRGWINYGQAKLKKLDYPKAEEAFLQALAVGPQNAYIYISMGTLKERTGKFDEADQYFLKAIASAPDFPESYFFYGQFLKNRKRFDEAIVQFNKVLSFTPAHLFSRYLLMEIYAGKQDYNNLMAMVKQTLQIDANNEKARAYLAKLQQSSANK